MKKTIPNFPDKPNYSSYDIKQKMFVNDYFFVRRLSGFNFKVKNCDYIIRTNMNGDIDKIYLRYLGCNYKRDLGDLVDVEKLKETISKLDFIPLYIFFHLPAAYTPRVTDVMFGRYVWQ